MERLQWEHETMLSDARIGYRSFLSKMNEKGGGVHGTWDDHDYGSNDAGKELTQKEERRNLYWGTFLNITKTDYNWIEEDG